MAPVGAQAADEPLVLAPASAWVMDYAEDSCALRRAFAGAGEEALLELRQFGPGDSYQAVIASGTLSRTSQPARVRYEPGGEFREMPASYFLDDGEMRGVLFNDSLRPRPARPPRSPLPDWPDAEREAREKEVTALSVSGAFQRSVTLQTGSMREPMEAMRTCLDELLEHWGLDAAVQRTLSRRARPLDLPTWARRIQEVYPAEMVRANRSGLVHVRLIVGADGKPTECIPNKDFSTPGFDDQACRIMLRHARFEPALDAARAPVASFYTTTITYQLRR